jgi:hypothetical protein
MSAVVAIEREVAVDEYPRDWKTAGRHEGGFCITQNVHRGDQLWVLVINAVTVILATFTILGP